jgi:hypothetical protein
VDLGFNKIILNLNKTPCDLNIDCVPDSSTVKNDQYKGIPYEYQDVKTFVGWNKISPAVVENMEQFDYLRVFQIRTIGMTTKNKGI